MFDIKNTIDISMLRITKNTSSSAKNLIHSFALKLMDEDMNFFNKAPIELLNDRDFILKAAEHNTNAFQGENKRLVEIYENDEEILIKLLKSNINLFNYLNEDAKNNENIATAVLSIYGPLLQKLPNFQNNREMVMMAINSSVSSYQYASSELKNDRGLAEHVIYINPTMFIHASEDLRNDKNLALITLMLAKNDLWMQSIILKHLGDDLNSLIGKAEDPVLILNTLIQRERLSESISDVKPRTTFKPRM